MSFELYRWAKGRKGLPPCEKAVLLAIADRTNDEKGIAWPSQDTLADDTGYERSTISRACKSLRDKGLLSWSKEMKPNGRFSSNCYKIHRMASNHMAEREVSVLHNTTSPCGKKPQKPLEEPKDITLIKVEGSADKGVKVLTEKQLKYAEKLAGQYFGKYKHEFYEYDLLLANTQAFLASEQRDEDWRNLGIGLPTPKDLGWM